MTANDTRTKRRYFYTDPLAAAWMAKHFGMRFQFVCEDEGDLYDPSESDFRDSYSDVWPRTAYVHPDSLHLLEPRIGDLMTNFGVAAWRLIGVSADRLMFCEGGNELFGQKGEMSTIQREGKPFFWPESEPIGSLHGSPDIVDAMSYAFSGKSKV